jgi:hypothetical protein
VCDLMVQPVSEGTRHLADAIYSSSSSRPLPPRCARRSVWPAAGVLALRVVIDHDWQRGRVWHLTSCPLLGRHAPVRSLAWCHHQVCP